VRQRHSRKHRVDCSKGIGWRRLERVREPLRRRIRNRIGLTGHGTTRRQQDGGRCQRPAQGGSKTASIQELCHPAIRRKWQKYFRA